MKHIVKCVLASCLLASTGIAFAGDKSVVIVNNDHKSVTVSYSVCDDNLCGFVQSATIKRGGKLVIK